MQENSPEIKQFIREHSNLFWYTPEDQKESISHELLIETILNYGDLEMIKKLFGLMGIKHGAQVFRNMTGRKKLNFYPEIYNYFSLYFDRYA